MTLERPPWVGEGYCNDARRLFRPRASLIGQVNSQPTWNQLRDSTLRHSDGIDRLLLLIIASVFRVGQTKGEDFVVSGSLNISITGTPIEDAVYD